MRCPLRWGWKAHWICVKKKEHLTDSLEREVKSLVQWTKEPCVHQVWNNAFSQQSSFLKSGSFLYSLLHRHQSYPWLITPVGGLGLALTPCLLETEHILWMLVSSFSAFPFLCPLPCQPALLIWPVWWQSHTVNKLSGVWSFCRVRMKEDRLSGWELFPLNAGAFPVLFLPN